jgi:hypothetical protein
MSPDHSLHSWLADYARTHIVQRYLEIGVREGDSLRQVVGNSKTVGVLYMADTWGSEYGGTGRHTNHHIERMLDRMGYAGRRIYLAGDSKETVPALPPQDWADLILVDGDHSAAGALADLWNCWPRLTDGGRLVFHDVHHPAHRYLESLFREFVSMQGGECEIITGGHGVGIAWKL